MFLNGFHGEAKRECLALCAKVLLVFRERLAASMEEVDCRCSDIIRETAEHRRNVLAHLSGGQSNDEKHHSMPQPLSKAIDSLRAICLQQNNPIEDDGELDLLEAEISRSLKDARTNLKKAISSGNGSIREKTASQEFNKKCQEIENYGLQEVERLRAQADERSKRMRARVASETKRKEMRFRLQAMRLERERVLVTKAEKHMQAIAEKTGNDYEKEVKRTQRLLKAKQTIMKHHRQQMKTQEGNNCIKIDFTTKIEGLKHQHTNRKRTTYRQERIKSKAMEQKKADEEALRLEEIRLERLNALAASVPYYKSIMDKTSDIHKSTQARKHDVYGGRSDLADFQSGKVKNFTNEKLFSDSRFCLGNALHEAGLANSTYARDVVRQAVPRVEARTTGIKPY